MWIAISYVPSLSGVLFPAVDYYRKLRKPPYSPPAWVFGPVWTVLYLLMGIAAWLVWKKEPRSSAWSAAIAMMIVQLILNALWTPIFFGLRRLRAALAELGLLWLAVATTLVLFWQQRPLAGVLMTPYLLWVSFAFYLNLGVVTLNRDE
jgi:tryptophan-rich sensory protein